MPEQQLSPPRYWIFKESSENYFTEKDYSNSYKIWNIEPNSEIESSDIVYFWRERDSSYIYGWARVKSTRTQLDIEAGASQSSSSEPRTRVQLRYLLFEMTPVMRQELYANPDLFYRLRQVQENILELNHEQAVALNRRIRANGFEAPPDPLLEPSPEQIEQEEEEGAANQTDDVNLGQLLEKYSGRLSALSYHILNLAGQFAVRREQNRALLTTSCIFFAAAELGGKPQHQELETASEFLFQWMHDSEIRASQYRRALEDFLGNADSEASPQSASLSANTNYVIETATMIANLVRKETVTSGREVIHARDLVGSLLFTMAGNSRLGAARRLAKVDVNLKTLREDYFNRYLNHPKNPDDDLEKWRLIILELKLPEKERKVYAQRKAPVPAIDADTPSLQDDLNITPDVKGFANIIAARDVKTPLSIGLFGDWGSGKSTFMEQLQAAVEEIAKRVRARKEGEETSFYGNIVQIKFNAWHYAEGNLWASLVSHVFENLSFSDKEEKEKTQQRKALFLGKLASGLAAQKAAEAEAKIKETKYEEARIVLDGAKREEKDASNERRRLLTHGVWPIVSEFLSESAETQQVLAAAEKELGRTGLTEEGLKREIEASRTTLGRAQRYFLAVRKDPRRWLKVALILVSMFLIPVGIKFAIGGSAVDWKGFISAVAEVVTLLTGVILWLGSKRETVNAVFDKLDAANRRLDQMYERARAEYDARLSQLDGEVAEKKVEVEKAKELVKNAKDDVSETVTTLKSMEPSRVLEAFVQERAASTDYRKLLGVVALIRRDFKRLSDMVREQDNVELKQAVREILKQGEVEPDEQAVDEKLREYRIDRIVLYIDDLDRCPPKQVVDVVQAIHLLLAFELFVVVVGVDARWIRHALRKRFPEMLSEDWDEGDSPGNSERRLTRTATPRDYVEKIFQVPFWLKPMDDDASRKLLTRLIPNSQLVPTTPDGELTNIAGQQETGGLLTGDGSASGDSQRHPVAPAEAKIPNEPIDKLEVDAKSPSLVAGMNDDGPQQWDIALKPENLLLDLKERDAMIALSRVIGRTPRTLKRFVNIYRIIKAGLNSEQLETFMGTSPSDAEYRAVLLLLSVSHGAPDVAPAFFLELKREDEKRTKDTEPGIGVKTFLNQLSTSPASVHDSLKEVWSCLITDLGKAAKDQDDIPVRTLHKWSSVVVRYTFQLGRLSDEIANASTPLVRQTSQVKKGGPDV